MKTILILGSNYAGVGTAHRLLKSKAGSGIKIIMVSPSTHVFWNIAAVRAIVPGLMDDDKIYQEIAPGFTQYGDRFEFVLGTAVGVDFSGKKVSVDGADGKKEITYDTLVLSTGSSTKEASPFKNSGSVEDTKRLMHEMREKVKNAEDIVVGGAGATGIETAGELAGEYGSKKKITLISSGPRVLEAALPSVSKVAASHLAGLKVNVKSNTKVDGYAQLPSGKTELSLSDGTKITTDLYIPTSGLVPNSSYLPSEVKNANGFVIVDEYLRVKGFEDAWAVGDISAVQPPQYVHTEKQSAHAAKNIELALAGSKGIPYNADQMKILFATVGKKAGAGQVGNWKFPGFGVSMIKGKTLFSQNLGPTVSGSHF